MIIVRSVEAQNRFGQLLDTVQREPVTITRHGRTLLRAVDRCQICATEATLDELRTVLQRPKFERYLALAQRLNFLDLVMRYVRRVEVDAHSVQLSKDACRDPRVPKWN